MTTIPSLPDTFKSFLESHKGKKPYEFDGVEWWLATSKNLLKKVDIDGDKFAYIEQLRGYANTLAEFLDSDYTTDDEGEDFALSRLEASLAFATGDGDVLFFDPSDEYSVWCFYHDGGDVERVASSFDDWLANAELMEDY